MMKEDSRTIINWYLNELEHFCENVAQPSLEKASPYNLSTNTIVQTSLESKNETQTESKVSFKVYQSRSGLSIPLVTLHNICARKTSTKLKWIPCTQRRREWTKEEDSIFQEAYERLSALASVTFIYIKITSNSVQVHSPSFKK